MKGALWEFWVLSTVVAFFVIVIWLATTPVFSLFQTSVYSTVNLTDTTVNQSTHDLFDYDMNMWNLWPIVAIVGILLFFFVISYDESEYKKMGGI